MAIGVREPWPSKVGGRGYLSSGRFETIISPLSCTWKVPSPVVSMISPSLLICIPIENPFAWFMLRMTRDPCSSVRTSHPCCSSAYCTMWPGGTRWGSSEACLFFAFTFVFFFVSVFFFILHLYDSSSLIPCHTGKRVAGSCQFDWVK